MLMDGSCMSTANQNDFRIIVFNDIIDCGSGVLNHCGDGYRRYSCPLSEPVIIQPVSQFEFPVAVRPGQQFTCTVLTSRS